MKRPCIERGCPNLTTDTRCFYHAREKDRRRGTRQQRGYDEAHLRMRRDLAATLPTPCGYGCGRVLAPDSKWVAAHVVDGDPMSPRIVSCLSCNERAKGKY